MPGPARFATITWYAQYQAFVRGAMMKAAGVRLHWLVGGGASNHSSRGQRLSLPARFDHQKDDWLGDAWSLVVEVTGVRDSTAYQVGIAKFLMPNVPVD